MLNWLFNRRSGTVNNSDESPTSWFWFCLDLAAFLGVAAYVAYQINDMQKKERKRAEESAALWDEMEKRGKQLSEDHKAYPLLKLTRRDSEFAQQV